MRKLKLDLEELRVESFDTSDVRAPTGTVKGHDDTEDASCGISCATCGPWTKCDCPPHTITTNDGSDSHVYRDGFCI